MTKKLNPKNIVKAVIPQALFKKIEPTGHLIEALAYNLLYGFPAKKLRFIGVTGTNGKTTTAFMIHNMLSQAGIKSALMSTVAYGVGDKLVYPKLHMTTNSSSVIQRRLKDFIKNKVEWVVLETSSHGLAQHRVWGIPYEIAVLTNITHDHLDYHGTFDNYLKAKQRLFRLANKHGLRLGIVNADSPNCKDFTNCIKNSTTYGIKSGDVRATNIKSSLNGLSYQTTLGNKTFKINVNIPGDFNIYNSLAAVVVGDALGLSKQQIEHGIGTLDSVAGRMHQVKLGQKFNVFIDFASTPDGFTQFFESIRPHVKGRLIAVFGSAGERDVEKRSLQGEIAGRYADLVVVTEEDNRGESGTDILKQIAQGAKKAGKVLNKSLHLIEDRQEAIRFALGLATNQDDAVVFLGKGHEKSIERADGEHPWDELKVVSDELKKLTR